MTVTRTANATKAALATARERRRRLDEQRDRDDQAVEERTAHALMALDALARADADRATAAGAVTDAVNDLLAEGVTVTRAAALLDLPVGDVQRLLDPDRPSSARRASRQRGARTSNGVDTDTTDTDIVPSAERSPAT